MSVTLFALSHNEEMLAHVPSSARIKRINLNDLTIEDKFRGQSLSENRFFLSDLALEVDSDFVGVFSARYHERYPSAPKLLELADQLETMGGQEFFAPWARRVSSQAELNLWIKTQQGVHPGMNEVLSTLNPKLPDREGYVFGGNQFAVSKENWMDFLTFWRKQFIESYSLWGLNPPFTYRCWNCGRSRPNGFSNYGPHRHAGFLGERITAMYFAQSNLKPFYEAGVSHYNRLFTAVFSRVPSRSLERLWMIAKSYKRLTCKICSG